MTLTDKLCKSIILVGGGVGMWVAASQPLFVRPYGQPALVNGAEFHRLHPTGFDQAQGQ